MKKNKIKKIKLKEKNNEKRKNFLKKKKIEFLKNFRLKLDSFKIRIKKNLVLKIKNELFLKKFEKKKNKFINNFFALKKKTKKLLIKKNALNLKIINFNRMYGILTKSKMNKKSIYKLQNFTSLYSAFIDTQFLKLYSNFKNNKKTLIDFNKKLQINYFFRYFKSFFNQRYSLKKSTFLILRKCKMRKILNNKWKKKEFGDFNLF
jgi:hypothetical protein